LRFLRKLPDAVNFFQSLPAVRFVNRLGARPPENFDAVVKIRRRIPLLGMIQLRERQRLIAMSQLQRLGDTARQLLVERFLPQLHLAREILRHQPLRRIVVGLRCQLDRIQIVARLGPQQKM
jgi:hypothetical protein